MRDEPDAMAAAILQLLHDSELSSRLALSARRNVEQNYDWPALGDSLADVHAELHGVD